MTSVSTSRGMVPEDLGSSLSTAMKLKLLILRNSVSCQGLDELIHLKASYTHSTVAGQAHSIVL
jgi:hypothetical protein